MLFQFLSRHICRIVVVEMMIYAGDVLYVIEHFGNIMAYDDDGAFPVDLFQHLVHLFLETMNATHPKILSTNLYCFIIV